MKVERVIVLSWIQNLLKKLKKDDEDEVTDLHNEMKSLPPIVREEGGKELETRIAYQYPKGSLPNSLPRKEPKKMPEQASQKRRERQHPEDNVKKQTVTRTAKPELPKVKKEVTPKSRGPFQPTEIPSPIFGFNRPTQSKDLIENELSHTRGPFQPTEIPSPIFGFNRPQSNDLIEHELSHFSTTLEKEPTNLREETVVHRVETVKHDSEKAMKESYGLNVLLRELDLREEAVDSKPEKGTFAEVSVTAEKETPAVMQPVELKQAAPEMMNQVIHQAAFAAEMVNQVNEESSVAAEMVNQVIEEAVAPPESITREETLEKASELDSSRAGGSHLPFNVLMLKQDKLRWEASKKRRRTSGIMEQPKAAEPVVKSREEIKEERVEKPQQIMTEIPSVKEEPVLFSRKEVQEELTQQTKQMITEQENNGLEGLYEFPGSGLLSPPVVVDYDDEWLQLQEDLLNQTLQNFNVGASVVNVTQGPSVTRFEVQPEPGVKVNKITNLSDDIKLSLAARDIRIEAPIPGKHTIGIEVPNQKSRPVFINEIIESSVFREAASPLTAVLGLDISGKPIVTDLKKMPHGLIAGATGSGKSVCINSILVSLLFKASPEDLKLLLIDPKMVELAPYNQIPHLVSPVITDVKAATAALKWAVEEMERRYELFAHTGVRDINRFNDLAIQHKRYSDKLPYIVIIIDELADLMMMSPADVEEAICRIAQKARACGIHLIVATQRPSVDVITGLIKANIPTRIAFSVSSQVDSRTIIDISGAEKLLGRGDMLFLENGSSKPVRLQGTFVSDEEIDLVVAHVREQREPEYLFQQDELLTKAQVTEEEDELFYEACEFIIAQGGASTSSLQRRFKIGYNRAARLMDMLEKHGFISGANGSKPREVLISESDLEAIQDGEL